MRRRRRVPRPADRFLLTPKEENALWKLARLPALALDDDKTATNLRGKEGALAQLPRELQRHVATYLQTKDALSLSVASKSYHWISADTVLWQRWMAHDFTVRHDFMLRRSSGLPPEDSRVGYHKHAYMKTLLVKHRKKRSRHCKSLHHRWISSMPIFYLWDSSQTRSWRPLDYRHRIAGFWAIVALLAFVVYMLDLQWPLAVVATHGLRAASMAYCLHRGGARGIWLSLVLVDTIIKTVAPRQAACTTMFDHVVGLATSRSSFTLASLSRTSYLVVRHIAPPFLVGLADRRLQGKATPGTRKARRTGKPIVALCALYAMWHLMTFVKSSIVGNDLAATTAPSPEADTMACAVLFMARVYFLLSRQVAPLLALESSVPHMGLTTVYDTEAFADDTPALYPWRTASFTLATYAYMWQVACTVQAGHESLRAEAKLMMLHKEANTHTGRQLAAIELLVRPDGTRTFSPLTQVKEHVTPRAIVKRWLIAASLLLLAFVLMQPAYVWRLELDSARAMSVPPYDIGGLHRRGIWLAGRVIMIVIEAIRSVTQLVGHYIVLPALKIVFEPTNVLYALRWILDSITSIASFLVWPLQQLARLLSFLPLPW